MNINLPQFLQNLFLNPFSSFLGIKLFLLLSLFFISFLISNDPLTSSFLVSQILEWRGVEMTFSNLSKLLRPMWSFGTVIYLMPGILRLLENLIDYPRAYPLMLLLPIRRTSAFCRTELVIHRTNSVQFSGASAVTTILTVRSAYFTELIPRLTKCHVSIPVVSPKSFG